MAKKASKRLTGFKRNQISLSYHGFIGSYRGFITSKTKPNETKKINLHSRCFRPRSPHSDDLGVCIFALSLPFLHCIEKGRPPGRENRQTSCLATPLYQV